MHPNFMRYPLIANEPPRFVVAYPTAFQPIHPSIVTRIQSPTSLRGSMFLNVRSATEQTNKVNTQTTDVSYPRRLDTSQSKDRIKKSGGLTLVEKDKSNTRRGDSSEHIEKLTQRLEIANQALAELEGYKIQNARLKSQNSSLREMLQHRKYSEQLQEMERSERITRLRQMHQQQNAEMAKKYYAVDKQRQQLRMLVIEYEAQLKQARQQNARLVHQVGQLCNVNNRIAEVEANYRGLQQLFEKDLEQWRIDKLRFQQTN